MIRKSVEEKLHSDSGPSAGAVFPPDKLRSPCEIKKKSPLDRLERRECFLPQRVRRLFKAAKISLAVAKKYPASKAKNSLQAFLNH
jgi:hypothetical protein